MKTVGMPRGLFYYYYYPWYKTFFNDLGARVILSSPTTRITVDQGINMAVDETCFPIKVYFGHVQELCQYDLDYLFVPRIVSVEARSYICPKFMGVPDMIRASIKLPMVIFSGIQANSGQCLVPISKVFLLMGGGGITSNFNFCSMASMAIQALPICG
jgi:hypothetical protein